MLKSNFCTSVEALKQLSKPIGRFMAADSATLNFTRPSYARMKVEIDLLKPLITEMFVGFSTKVGNEDKGYIQRVEYERIPFYCAHCFKHGHNIEICRLKLAKDGVNGNVNERGRSGDRKECNRREGAFLEVKKEITEVEAEVGNLGLLLILQE